MPGFQNVRQTTPVEDAKSKSWQDALQTVSLAALAKGANTQTMLGFALGKWLSNYLNNGAEKRQREKDRQIAMGKAMSDNINAVGQQSADDIAKQLAHPTAEGNSTEFKLPAVTGLLGGSINNPSADTGNWSDRVNVLDVFKPKY